VTRHGWWKVLIFVALFGVCSIATVAAQGATYTDPQGHYSFTVPSGWQPGSVPQNTNLPAGTVLGGVFNAAAPLNGNLNVVTVAVPAGLTLDQIVTQSRAGVASTLAGYQEGPGGIQNLTVGGQPARRYDYFLMPQASKLHGAQVIILQAGIVYILTFTAAENDFATFFQQGATVLTSFKFTGTGGGTSVTTLPSTGRPTGMRWQDTRELFIVMVGGVLVAAGSLCRRRYARL